MLEIVLFGFEHQVVRIRTKKSGILTVFVIGLFAACLQASGSLLLNVFGIQIGLIK